MEHPSPDLGGSKVLVLGASDPAAAAIALAFAKAGADVAVTSTTGDAEEAFALRPLRRAIEGLGRQAIADIADLGNGSSVQIAVRQIAKQFGRIDVMVIASSEPLDKPSERITDAEWSRAIGFNFGAYFYACRAITREFAGNEPVEGVRGRIIALLPSLELAAPALHHAARAGTEALLEGLAREWADDGIVVTSIASQPGTSEEAVVEAAMEAAVAGTADTGRVLRT